MRSLANMLNAFKVLHRCGYAHISWKCFPDLNEKINNNLRRLAVKQNRKREKKRNKNTMACVMLQL